MSSAIVPQDRVEVKEECGVDWCHEPVFRDSGLCFTHFIEEETAAWNDHTAERQEVLGSLGYVLSPDMEVYCESY